jgi:RNA recognition motif-containing protein
MACSVTVSNISPLIEQQHIEDLFNAIGPVSACTLTRGGESSSARVVFGDPSHAAAALYLNGTPLGDKNLVIALVDAAAEAAAATAAAAAAAVATPPATNATPTGTPVLPIIPAFNPMAMFNPAMLAAPLNPFAMQQAMMHQAMMHQAMMQQAAAALQQSAAQQQLGSAATAAKPTEDDATGLNASLPVAAPTTTPYTLSEAARKRNEEVARTVYVGNIAPECTEEHVRQLFEVCGPMLYIKIAGENSSDKNTRYAFIEFATPEAVNAALTLTNVPMLDRIIKVGRANNPIVKSGAVAIAPDPNKISEGIYIYMCVCACVHEVRTTAGLLNFYAGPSFAFCLFSAMRKVMEAKEAMTKRKAALAEEAEIKRKEQEERDRRREEDREARRARDKDLEKEREKARQERGKEREQAHSDADKGRSFSPDDDDAPKERHGRNQEHGTEELERSKARDDRRRRSRSTSPR